MGDFSQSGELKLFFITESFVNHHANGYGHKNIGGKYVPKTNR
jgi:hypothetical protein